MDWFLGLWIHLLPWLFMNEFQKFQRKPTLIDFLKIILAPMLSLFVTAVELYVLCEETFDRPA